MNLKTLGISGAIVLALIAGAVAYKRFLPLATSDISPSPTNTPFIEPEDKISCEKIGGIWTENAKFCTLPAADANKPCYDGSECQSKTCSVELTKEQQEAARKSPDGLVYVKGKCSGWMVTLGCHTRVLKGKAGPATTLCAD